VRQFQGVRLLARHEYEGVFGLVLFGMFLLSTLDETALAPVGRGLSLASYVLLSIVNAGAALAVYIGVTLVFSVHHFAGQGSWVERPDNYALLIFVFVLAIGRPLVRKAGVLGSPAAAVAVFIMVSLSHLSLLGDLDAFHFTWFMRMFGIPFLLFVLLRRARLTREELRALFLVVSGIAIYLAAGAVLEALGWYAVMVPPWVGDPSFNPGYGSDRIGGLLMQPEWNALAISLCMAVLAFRLRASSQLVTLAKLAGIGLCIAGIYLSYTRAAWLALLVAGVPAFWYASGRRGVTFKRRLAFVGCVLLVSAVTILFPSQVTESRMSDVGTVYFRLNVWVAGLRMVIDHPLFGVGFGEFANHVGNYQQAGGWIPALGGGGSFGELAHNTFLSVAGELGIVGLTLYVVIIVSVFRTARTAAGDLWGQAGKLWVDAFSIIYYVNVQFITAHELITNVIYFGIMGAIAGAGLLRNRPLQSVKPAPAEALS